MDIPADWVESNKENMFREEANAKFDPADVSSSVSDYPEQNAEEVNKAGTPRGRGCGRERENK